MLKYFKRQKSSRKSREDCENDDCRKTDTDTAKRHSLRSTSSFCDEVFLTDDADGGAGALSLSGMSVGVSSDEDVFKYQSRLSMSLPTIVNDPNCLSYFVQYLETKKGLPLIKFYLDTENFQTAALTQLEKEEENALQHPSVLERHEEHESSMAQQNNEEDHEDEENNSVPELKTLCDLSMRKPLTDDEKSQIYAETNKQITKCNNNSKQKTCSELSLCSDDPADRDNGNASKVWIKDAIAIYKKYLIADAQDFVSLPVAILSQISLLLCKRDGSISPQCFAEAQEHVLRLLEEEYLDDFLQSTFYCKYCIELIGGRASAEKLTIYDILHSEVALFFFMEFLEQQRERDCLDFWTTAINFRKSYTTLTPPRVAVSENDDDAQADAMIIYEKFFSLQSESRLWMTDKLRSRVEERICATGGLLEVAHCFDLPLQVTAKYLEQKYFDDFIRSQLFENYVNELKSKIHDAGSDFSSSSQQNKLNVEPQHGNKASRHRKTMSDCTNESTRDLLKNISQQNTLLASMDTSSTPLKKLNTSGYKSGTNLNIDSRHLTNPNLLWYRSSADGGGLKFGQVNSLGRYSRFDAVDACANSSASKHNWSMALGGNKIKRAMRKLVNLPEEKVQEEIAWQVAEMIVKDVTNVTLSNGK